MNRDPERALSKRMEDRRDDPARLEKPAADITVRSPGSHVVSVRIPTGEFLQLQDSARASHQRVGDYVRGAIRMRIQLEDDIASRSMEVMSDRLIQTQEAALWFRWSGNPLPHSVSGIPSPKSA